MELYFCPEHMFFGAKNTILRGRTHIGRHHNLSDHEILRTDGLVVKAAIRLQKNGFELAAGEHPARVRERAGRPSGRPAARAACERANSQRGAFFLEIIEVPRD